MKVFSYLNIIIIFLCGFSHKAFSQYSKWIKDTTFNKIEFEKVRFREDGRKSLYVKGILKQKTFIDGFPCHKKVTLNKDGKLKFFILAEDCEVAGNFFKKETHVVIRSDNTFLIHCLYEPTVQGYKIRRTNYKKFLFMGSTNFQLYESGKLLFFQPVNDINIEGVWCKPSPSRGGVHLFENGKLQECTSAKDQVIQGKKIEKNFTIKFDRNGKLYYAKKEKFFGED